MILIQSNAYSKCKADCNFSIKNEKESLSCADALASQPKNQFLRIKLQFLKFVKCLFKNELQCEIFFSFCTIKLLHFGLLETF